MKKRGFDGIMAVEINKTEAPIGAYRSLTVLGFSCFHLFRYLIRLSTTQLHVSRLEATSQGPGI